MRKLLLVILILAGAARAQAQSSAFYPFRPPIPNTTVRVCPVPSGGRPCPAPSAIFSDSGLVNPVANPFTTGKDGNFGFWAAPGQYTIQLSGAIFDEFVITLGGGNGSGNPSVGNPGDVQSATAGHLFQASHINDSNGIVKVSETLAPAGPDPVTDIRDYNAYANYSTTTATTNGTTSVTLGSAQNFLNNEYVVVRNAGTACTLATPSAPTVTPGVNIGGAFNVSGGVAGANPNAYKIVAVSTTGCYSIASASGSTAAAPTLGMVGYTISAVSATNGIATVTTSSAHSFIVGQMIFVQYGASTNPFQGWFAVNTVPDNTHFTFLFPGDTRVAAPTVGGVTAQPSCTVTNTVLTNNIATVTCANSFTNGPNVPVVISGTTNSGGAFNGSFQTTALSATQFSFYLQHANITTAADSGTSTIAGVWGFNVNALTWPAVTNAFKYFIYGRDGGNFNLIGQTMFNSWNDYGFQMESGQSFPSWAPTTAPASSGNNHLSAQIVSGGGSTTLVLSVAAGASISTSIVSDDGPAIVAALNAAKGQNQYCAPVLIHNTAPGTFGIQVSSFTDTTSTNCSNGTLLINGAMNLTDTMEIRGLSIKGTAGTAINNESFGQVVNGPQISMQAYPGFWFPSFSQGVHLENVYITSFGSNGTNNDLEIYNQGLMDTFDYVHWTHNTAGPLSLSQIIDNTSSGFTYKFNFNTIDGAYFGQIGYSPYSSMIITGFGQSGASSGLLQVSHTWFINKGGFDFEQTNAQGGGNYLLKDISTESHSYPVIVLSGPSLGQPIANAVDIDGVFVADTPVPLIAVIGGSTALLPNSSIRQAGCGSGGTCNTGNPLVGLSQTSVSSGSQRLFSSEQYGSKNVVDGIFNTTQPGAMGFERFSEIVTIPSAFSLTSTVPGVTSGPTCSVSSGGSIPTGTWQFIVIPVWWNNSEGSPSNFSNGCTTSTGNQTITVNWSGITSTGVIGYDVYRCQNSTNCVGVKGLPAPMYPGSQTSVVLTAFGGTTSPSTDAAGGPTMLSGTFLATQNLDLGAGNSGGYVNITVPMLTVTPRFDTIPDASGQFVLDATFATVLNNNLFTTTLTPLLVPLLNPNFDNFQRANGGLGSHWTNNETANGTMVITGNTVTGGSSSLVTSAFWNVNTFPADQWAQGVVTAPGLAVGVQLRASGSTTPTAYGCYETNSTLEILKLPAFSTVASVSVTGATGDTIRGTVTGTTVATISCISTNTSGVSTTVIGTDSSSVITSGQPGVSVQGNSATITNFLSGYTTFFGDVSLNGNFLTGAVGNSGLIAQSGSTTKIPTGDVWASDANGNAIDGGTPGNLAVAWSSLQAPTGPLTLAMTTAVTNFNHTTNTNGWFWNNTTAATSSVSQSSPLLNLCGTAWNGSASITDCWQYGNVVSNGTNGQSTFTFTHTGSSGPAFVNATSFCAGSVCPAVVAGTAGVLAMVEGTDATNVANTSLIDANGVSHEFTACTNGSTTCGMLVRRQPGAIHQTAQTAAISTATLCATAAGACNIAGQYHVHIDMINTGTACTSVGPAAATPTITWTDTNGTVHTAVPFPMITNASATALSTSFIPTVSALTAWASGDMNISTNGAVQQYSVGYTGCTTGTFTYQFDAAVTRLQ